MTDRDGIASAPALTSDQLTTLANFADSLGKCESTQSAEAKATEPQAPARRSFGVAVGVGLIIGIMIGALAMAVISGACPAPEDPTTTLTRATMALETELEQCLARCVFGKFGYSPAICLQTCNKITERGLCESMAFGYNL